MTFKGNSPWLKEMYSKQVLGVCDSEGIMIQRQWKQNLLISCSQRQDKSLFRRSGTKSFCRSNLKMYIKEGTGLQVSSERNQEFAIHDFCIIVSKLTEDKSEMFTKF
jgi:hypothetical protein